MATTNGSVVTFCDGSAEDVDAEPAGDSCGAVDALEFGEPHAAATKLRVVIRVAKRPIWPGRLHGDLNGTRRSSSGPGRFEIILTTLRGIRERAGENRTWGTPWNALRMTHYALSRPGVDRESVGESGSRPPSNPN
jgi:hypothetical protein